MKAAAAESHTLTDLYKFLAMWKGFHRFRQISVSSFIAGDHATDQRQDAFEVKAEELFGRKATGNRRFQDDGGAARLEHPEDLAQAFFQVFKIPCTKTHRNRTDAIVFEGKVLGIALHHADQILEAFFLDLFLPHRQHTRRDVQTDDLLGFELPRLDGEVPRAGSDVQNDLGFEGFEHTYGFAAPTDIDPHTERMVQEIVAGGDVVEHLRNLLLFRLLLPLIGCDDIAQIAVMVVVF